MNAADAPDLVTISATKGYLALCPDLFWRQQPDIQLTDKSPAEWDRAFELYKGFDVEAGVRDLLATLAHLRSMPGCSGKVGAVGYCLGGKLAYLMAARSDCRRVGELLRRRARRIARRSSRYPHAAPHAYRRA